MFGRIQSGDVRLISRQGKSWTASFQAITEALAAVRCENAWLDGEVVAVDATGRVSFEELQAAARSRRYPASLYYFVFDLPYWNGRDLRGVPLESRKALLEQIIGKAGHPAASLLQPHRRPRARVLRGGVPPRR